MAIILRKAELLVLTGNWDQAESLYARGLDESRRLDSVPASASCSYGLGEVERLRGNYPQALKHLDQAAALFRVCDDPAGLARVHGAMGGVYAEQGDYPRAGEYMAMRLAHAERAGDLMEIGIASGNIGVIHAEQRDFDTALVHYRKQLGIAEQLQDLVGIGIALGNIGNAHLFRNEHREAIECYRQATDLALKLGDKRNLCTVSCNLGLLYKRQGNLEVAVTTYAGALAAARAIGFSRACNIISGNLGSVYRQMGEWQRAAECLTICHDGSAAVGDIPGVARSGFELAGLDQLQGAPDRAINRLETVTDICREHALDLYGLVALNALTGLYLQAGRSAEAHRVNQEALRLVPQCHDAEESARAEMYRWVLLDVNDRSTAISGLQGMLAQGLSDPVRADVLSNLHELTGGEDFRRRAAAAFMELYRRENDAAFRIRAEELDP